MSNDKDFETVNQLALEQIQRFKTPDSSMNSSSTFGARKSFWDEPIDRSYRPSAKVPLLSGTSQVQPSYYSSSRVNVTGDSPEAYFRRTLNAVYRAPEEDAPILNMDKKVVVTIPANYSDDEVVFVFGGSLLESLFGSPKNVPGNNSFMQGMDCHTDNPNNLTPSYEYAVPSLNLSPATKNQLLAITLSYGVRALSTIIHNWSKKSGVPYELL